MESKTQFTIESKKKNIEELTEEHKKELDLEKCEIISLKGNSYSKNFFGQLAEIVTQSKSLQRININDVFVGRGKDEIPQSLEVFARSLVGKQIQKIDISNNAVNPFGAQALKPFLGQAESLKVLLINNCGLGIQGVTHIAEGLQQGSHNLEVLAIARNRAEDEGAQQLAKALVQVRALRELHIYQNGIKEVGMIELLQSLNQNCPNLEVLDIRDNFIHENTAPVLAKLISSSKNLKALNISDCNLESEFNEHILESLENSSLSLERLGYNYAELSDKQANRLLDWLQKNLQTLQRLDIKGNNLKNLTKKRFRAQFEEAQKKSALSVFDSDEEDDNEVADELAKEFSVLKI